MTARLEKTFAALKARKRAALIPFVMGGDPDADTSLAILRALPKAGADIVEIGIPFSDPMADGPVIEAAGLRALKGGMTLAGVLKLVGAFRKENGDTPVVLMGYFNPLYHYGLERFCTDAAAAGVDAVIVVDLPPEEAQELCVPARRAGLAVIRLTAPTSLGERLPTLLAGAEGFLYYIAITGITGAASASMERLRRDVQALKAKTALPIAVGFGIKTPEQAKEAAGFADAVVIGSALVARIAQAKDAKAKIEAAAEFVSSLADSITG